MKVMIAMLFISISAHAQTQQRLYKPLKDTAGISYNQIASLCPKDGITPCSGGLAGWTWATKQQVIELFQKYQPDFSPDIPNPYPMAGYFYAQGVMSEVKTTFSMYLTYQTAEYAAGLTSTVDEYGVPYIGQASAGSTNVSFNGGLSIDASGSVNTGAQYVGAFLWRDPNIPLPEQPKAIKANSDNGSLNPGGGTPIANVLANDLLGSAPATLANVNLSLVSSSDGSISLNLETGAVSLSASASIGSHSLTYKICEKSFPDNCATAVATINVVPLQIYAGADSAQGDKKKPATLINNVLTNDWLGNRGASLQTVTLSQVSSTSSYVQLTIAGAVQLTSKVDGGTYRLQYRICERANPTNCAIGNVTLLLK